MNSPNFSHSRWPAGHLALIAVAVMALRLFAWEIHEISEHHGPLDECFICVQADRSDTWLPSEPAVCIPLPASGFEPVAVPAPAPVACPLARFPRGPPVILSS